MATTDLSSRSLGDVYLQSGIGTPDHTAPKGSLYTNKSTGVLYMNSSGTAAWLPMSTAAYAEAFYQDNVTATAIAAANTWTAVGNNFTLGSSIGFSASTSTLVSIAGYEGNYQIRGDVTISYVAGSNNFEVGLSVNGANPVDGTYGGAFVDVTYTRQHIGFETVVSLTGGTNLRFAIRNLVNADDVIIRHAQLSIRKVD
jgi:hypothetical protein